MTAARPEAAGPGRDEDTTSLAGAIAPTPEIRQGRPSERRLLAEMAAAGDLDDSAIEALWRKHGLPADELLASGARVARVVPIGRLYLPDPSGLRALVLPCWGRGGGLLNLLAVRPSSGEWWTRIPAAGGVLNPELLDTAIAIDGGCWLFASPLGWLRGRRGGVLVLGAGP